MSVSTGQVAFCSLQKNLEIATIQFCSTKRLKIVFFFYCKRYIYIWVYTSECDQGTDIVIVTLLSAACIIAD